MSRPVFALSTILGAVLGTHFATPVAAQSAGAEVAAAAVYRELAQCRALRDVPARVACYDGIAMPAALPAAATPATASAAAAVAGSAPASPAPVAASFGLSVVPAAPARQSIDSRIVGAFEGWSSGTRLRLENGQVWEVVDTTRASYDIKAPAVRIKRGVLGSFFMEVAGVSATPRVRRVE